MDKRGDVLLKITFAVLVALVFVQLIRYIFGGTWLIEDIILALVVLNLTITFGIGGYLISLNDTISQVDKKLYGHFEWHRGIK
ncbi:MAG TPA: hypothetical protein VJH88_06430 [Candidatus Nanoarchaeia archaeon]|nr:hypothetical protein [Candidatus Nanoarchaeia archaeon]